VAVTWLPLPLLEPFMPTLTTQLLEWSSDSRNEFRLKVSVIFERLLKRVGFDSLAPYFPEDHRRFLVNIRKSVERQKRKKNETRSAYGDDFDQMMEGEEHMDEGEEEQEEEEEDEDVGMEDADGAAAADADADEQLDMLDGGRLQAAMAQEALRSRKGKRSRDDDDDGDGDGNAEFAVNDDGRLIIEEESQKNGTDATFEEKEELEIPQAAKRVKKAMHPAAEKYKQTGSMFKSKKAGGDVKKGGMDPYAYLPLDSRFMNKKKARQASKGLQAVISGTKAGAAHAKSKAKRQGHGGRR